MIATLTRPGAARCHGREPARAPGIALSARWLPAGLIGAGAALIPWLIVLAAGLPSAAMASHWAAAWAGLDAMEAIGLLTTGTLLARRNDRGRLTAMATAALLIADAWLDVMTSAAGQDQAVAVAMAVFCELPVAGLCVTVALRRSWVPAWPDGQDRPI